MDAGSSITQANATARFNVGGKIYEVSKSLLEQYPDTMLTRLASDTWHPGSKRNGNEEASCGVDNTALFIERDGGRFRYCLDYMRDGGVVVLPLTIPKTTFLQDLVYYGFEGMDQSKITVLGSLSTFTGGIEHINLSLTKLKKEALDLETKFKNEALDREIKPKCLELVKFCLCHYVKKASLEITVVYKGGHSESKELHATACASKEPNGAVRRQFNEYLKIFGLNLTEVEGPLNCKITLCLEKL
jgi:hypothetical protein